MAASCLPRMPLFDSLVKCSLSIASNQSHFFTPVTSIFIVKSHFSVYITGGGFILVLFSRISFSAAFTGFINSSPKELAEDTRLHACIAEVSHCCRVCSCVLSRCLAGEAEESCLSHSQGSACTPAVPGMTPGCWHTLVSQWAWIATAAYFLPLPPACAGSGVSWMYAMASMHHLKRKIFTCLQDSLALKTLFVFQLCHKKIPPNLPYLFHYSPQGLSI